jgi:hypothetical protein
MMPLDASLNKDVDDGVHAHLVFTDGLDNAMPQKFSMSTPVKGSFAYRRVWNSPAIPGLEGGEMDIGGIPSSHRIIQDINKFTTSCMSIYEHHGTVVPGLGTRNGHRHETEAKNRGQVGGARTKKVDEDSTRFIHPDARVSRQNILLDSKRRHNSEGGAALSLDLEKIDEGCDSDDESLGNLEDDVEYESCQEGQRQNS